MSHSCVAPQVRGYPLPERRSKAALAGLRPFDVVFFSPLSPSSHPPSFVTRFALAGVARFRLDSYGPMDPCSAEPVHLVPMGDCCLHPGRPAWVGPTISQGSYSLGQQYPTLSLAHHWSYRRYGTGISVYQGYCTITESYLRDDGSVCNLASPCWGVKARSSLHSINPSITR